MNKILLIGVLVVLAVVAFLGYKVMTKPAASTVVVSSELNAELEKTVDDAGQADFDSLTQDSAGL